ncbi:ferritin-like domain-containing protein [Candidatus Woesearchaeota archaeon]|nr:ferritin-like domain-containing protein [Candidatus Woesearchaeota archaeon]
MYSEKDMLRVLRRNLESELKVIKFYVDNAEKLDYAKNKPKVDSLVFDSFRHAQWLSRQILRLKTGSGKLTKKAKAEALREETNVRDIYQYELNRTEDPKVRKVLQKLISEEKKHARIVRGLK